MKPKKGVEAGTIRFLPGPHAPRCQSSIRRTLKRMPRQGGRSVQNPRAVRVGNRLSDVAASRPVRAHRGTAEGRFSPWRQTRRGDPPRQARPGTPGAAGWTALPLLTWHQHYMGADILSKPGLKGNDALRSVRRHLKKILRLADCGTGSFSSILPGLWTKSSLHIPGDWTPRSF